jgi:hypothetical protein
MSSNVYVATIAFSIYVDEIDQTLTIKKDSEVLYDGKSSVTLNGTTYTCPKIGTAIRAGWLRAIEDTDAVYRPTVSNRKLRAATPQQNETSVRVGYGEDSQVVSSINQSRSTVVPVDNSDATPVKSSFKTAAKPGKIDVSQVKDVGVETFNKAEDVVFVDYDVTSTPVSKIVSPRGETQTDNGGRKTLAAAKSPVDLEDSLDPRTKEGRWKVAKIIHPDLPDWDFTAHWRHKISKLKEEWSENDILVRAVYASESEALKRRILEEFPNLI